MAAQDSHADTIVVGIDFGTTYSGIAWAYSGEPDSVEIVTSWESELNQCSDVEKCPTQIYYGEKSDAINWGYAVPTDKEAIQWFKLLLLDDGDIPRNVATSPHLKKARELRGLLNKTPVELIASFLRKIWNHAVDSINDSVGDKLLTKCRFHVVITLPAIWPLYAQSRMKTAVENSGIVADRPCGKTELRFISEPEAAALATISDLSKRSTTKAGDTLVVCDAGGGTVDLISYVIESVNPFVVKECVKGDGGLCGGIFLDEKFLELMKTKVGPGIWGKVTKTETTKLLNDDWEHGIKRQFQNQDRSWLITLPESCQDYDRNGTSKVGTKRKRDMTLSSQEIMSVYSPIVESIKKLVKDQCSAIRAKYSKEPEFVVLVGGFGRSPFLRESLKATLPFETTILQSRGSKPWSAICRGAVIQGITRNGLSTSLSVQIGARIARASYGIQYSKAWDSTTHLIKDKYWCEVRRKWKASNQMKWLLRQGDNITNKSLVRYEYAKYLDEPKPKLTCDLYFSSIWLPSSRRDHTVHKLCTITWTQTIDIETLPTWTNSIGKVYRKLKYEIEMTCEQGTVDFAINFGGNRVGGRNVQVDFY